MALLQVLLALALRSALSLKAPTTHAWAPQDLTKDRAGFAPIPDNDYVKKYGKGIIAPVGTCSSNLEKIGTRNLFENPLLPITEALPGKNLRIACACTNCALSLFSDWVLHFSFFAARLHLIPH